MIGYLCVVCHRYCAGRCLIVALLFLLIILISQKVLPRGSRDFAFESSFLNCELAADDSSLKRSSLPGVSRQQIERTTTCHRHPTAGASQVTGTRRCPIARRTLRCRARSASFEVRRFWCMAVLVMLMDGGFQECGL